MTAPRGDRQPPDGLGEAASPDIDHRKGHRERARQRFLKVGEENLDDYELLELVLFLAIPRIDTKLMAKQLIARFGSYSAVLSAPPERLAEVEGIKGAAATNLKIVQAAAQRFARHRVDRELPILGSWSALIDYCRSQMAFNTIEEFRILFLDKKNRLMADEVQQRGTVDHTPVYPREVIKRALELGATAVILVHNHPTWPFRSRSITPHHLETQELLGLSQSRSLWHIGVGFKGIKALFDPSRRPHEPVERPQLEADGEPQCQALQMEKFAEP